MFETRLTRRQFGAVSLLSMLTGSQVFPGIEPPEDEDFIAFGDEDDFHELIDDGWGYGGSCVDEDGEPVEEWPGNSPFVSLTKGKQNIILSRDAEFVAAWIAAHDECVESAPDDKEGRIKVFRKHLYNELSHEDSAELTL